MMPLLKEHIQNGDGGIGKIVKVSNGIANLILAEYKKKGTEGAEKSDGWVVFHESNIKTISHLKKKILALF